MATVNFKYNYPYAGYGEEGRFQCQWSETRTSLNGSYTYPMLFNNPAPSVSHIIVDIEIENTGSGTVYGRSWDFMVQKSNGSWVDVLTFTLPDDGLYTIDCDVPNYTIKQIACLPSSNPGSSRTWTNWYGIQELTITETVELQPLTTGKYLYGVFPNKSGVSKVPVEVSVNMGGTLTAVTDVLANINGSLISVPSVHSAYLSTASDSMALYSFTAPTDGTYRICNKRTSGDHEIRAYSSDFTPLYDGYFYDQSFQLTAGTLLYISVTHYLHADASESNLQIYKEA